MNFEFVTKTKDFRKKVDFIIIEGCELSLSFRASRLLTGSHCESTHGIFSYDAEVSFSIYDTNVSVDFGCAWSTSDYQNPAREIERRCSLVREAFEKVRCSSTTTYAGQVELMSIEE